MQEADSRFVREEEAASSEFQSEQEFIQQHREWIKNLRKNSRQNLEAAGWKKLVEIPQRAAFSEFAA